MKFFIPVIDRKNSIDDYLNEILEKIHEGSEKSCDLVIFGEAILQGFDSLNFDYKNDIEISLGESSREIAILKKACNDYKIGLGFGYYENFKGAIYSSYMVISDKGETILNYRRRSPGWKEAYANKDYREGSSFLTFEYKNKSFLTLICGDFFTDEFLEDISSYYTDYLLWPAHLDFSLDVWKEEKKFYLERTEIVPMKTIFVNSLKDRPTSSFVSYHGKILGENNKMDLIYED
ncbi:carbon-nitrogen hydrolase family protein [Citroniella saccharovorans]|uniref:Carbon-nitrogen hydrolase family protein n=1 Tax=Citroniella saccharovorans TaxID=2053367 RepID=A0AAW9MP50_9FIRM|nr:carbon-nitrogen hydrolase family protein [Citroniella saccharovorans]MEB3428796.1 carbon-nitrogen hydrolase family protein [Citroniella saccharovorans]